MRIDRPSRNGKALPYLHSGPQPLPSVHWDTTALWDVVSLPSDKDVVPAGGISLNLVHLAGRRTQRSRALECGREPQHVLDPAEVIHQLRLSGRCPACVEGLHRELRRPLPDGLARLDADIRSDLRELALHFGGDPPLLVHHAAARVIRSAQLDDRRAGLWLHAAGVSFEQPLAEVEDRIEVMAARLRASLGDFL